MADFAWLVRRLKAMSVPEVAWRVSQKAIQKSEEKRFKSRKTAVTETLFNEKLSALQLDEDRMCLNWDNQCYSLNTKIPLLGGYNYEIYKRQWNAGFQTEHKWPEQFSYDLEYKQRDDIGDARTNWELNRHFQFALLAKDYAASGESKYLSEFIELFEDWNTKNPFLWGISWTSVMEVAIRCSNWCYAWCFLKGTDAPKELLDQLQTGILNMTDYIANHYSRYSSANNHLIVEAYAIGQTGVLCNYTPWIKLAVDILTRELPLQNYSDGINKELSLHYQSFYMEAMGLMMRLLIKNGIEVPAAWNPMLDKMCSYVANCMGDYGEVVVFGDDDDGKILDLHGGLNHYQYVLGLFSLMMDKQYTKLDGIDCENLHWLFGEEDWNQALKKPLHCPPLSVCYREGGNTILRSEDRRILIGIDHAALGFGSIAAHGHADALSFQMFVDGNPVFVDPGTYIYHCDLESRNAFRKTENHNTVCINGKDQSEMLGAFLWGRKAECELIDYSDGQKIILRAKHDGYKPALHCRSFEFDKNNKLIVKDEVKGNSCYEINYLFAPGTEIRVNGCHVETVQGIARCIIDFDGPDIDEINIVEVKYSKEYGIRETAPALKIKVKGEQAISKITVEV